MFVGSPAEFTILTGCSLVVVEMCIVGCMYSVRVISDPDPVKLGLISSVQVCSKRRDQSP